MQAEVVGDAGGLGVGGKERISTSKAAGPVTGRWSCRPFAVRAIRALSSSRGRSVMTSAAKASASKAGRTVLISRPIRAIRSGLSARSLASAFSVMPATLAVMSLFIRLRA